jgi:hypothetical protein
MSTYDDPRVSDHDDPYDALFERLKLKAPFAAGFIDWVRRPSSMLLRIPLAILLIFGGVFSFLPILGIWMLPLGLLILALDIPPLRGPVVGAIGWVENRWNAWHNRKR